MSRIDFTILAQLRQPKRRPLNLLNQKFHRLTPLAFLGRLKRNTMWLCRCDCGNFTMTSAHKLRQGHTRSCGCFVKERVIEANRTHGQTLGGRKTHVYNAWLHMKNRILNPRNDSYHNYGGRGLDLYEPWLQFENFVRDMGLPPSSKHTIERVDNAKGYAPDNCIWATRAIQNANTRRNRYLTANNETHCLSEWARRQNLDPKTILYRLKTGRTVEESLGLVPFIRKRSWNWGRRK